MLTEKELQEMEALCDGLRGTVAPIDIMCDSVLVLLAEVRRLRKENWRLSGEVGILRRHLNDALDTECDFATKRWVEDVVFDALDMEPPA